MQIIKHTQRHVLSMFWYSALVLLLSSVLASAQQTITVLNDNPLGVDSFPNGLVRGTILRTSGMVTLVSSSGMNININPNMKIPIGSILKTGQNSWLTVHWMEGADSVLTENTKLSVLALDYSENAGLENRRVIVRLYSGKIYNRIIKKPGALEVRIKTSSGDYLSHDCRARLGVSDEEEVNQVHPTLNTELAVQEGEVQAMIISGSVLSVPRQNQASISTSDQQIALNPTEPNTLGNNIRLQSLNKLSGTNTDITNYLRLLELPTVVYGDVLAPRGSKISYDRGVFFSKAAKSFFSSAQSNGSNRFVCNQHARAFQ